MRVRVIGNVTIERHCGDSDLINQVMQSDANDLIRFISQWTDVNIAAIAFFTQQLEG